MNKALLGAAVMTDLIRATSGPSLRELYRSLERYVDCVLRGTKPSDLPFDLPTKFELVIKLKTAKAIGLTIPPRILATDDQVVE